MTSPESRAKSLYARTLILEDAVLAAWEIINDTVPDEPRGLKDWYFENLTEIVNEITTRKNGNTK